MKSSKRLYVAYYRVSTQKQGESGLGLEAQQAAVKAFAGEPIESYTEVESGKRSDRPQLALAIAACKRLGATLVIAKLVRLARNVHFVSGLMESGIEFVACDNPNANRLTVHILAAVAEDEARRISERTKAALAAYKARGGRLGNPRNLTTVAARKGTAANAKAAKSHREAAKKAAIGLRAKGYSLAAIAETLTGRGLLTRRGKAWSPTAVMRLLG
jgi:DNA invertase Pin-like site-specific DNA recombinase